MGEADHHQENGSAAPGENGMDPIAAADAAKMEANAHFKGLQAFALVTTISSRPASLLTVDLSGMLDVMTSDDSCIWKYRVS